MEPDFEASPNFAYTGILSQIGGKGRFIMRGAEIDPGLRWEACNLTKVLQRFRGGMVRITIEMVEDGEE